MNNNLLKYVNKFFTAFEKDHTFYIDGERIRFCRATDVRVVWAIKGGDWDFLFERHIKEVSIMATSLTITAMNGRAYTFIAKPTPKREIAERIIFLMKNKLIRIPYSETNKRIIDEMMQYLDELNRTIA